MIRVGLTGGIGSGKSMVAGYFRELGVPVYNSDLRARELMEKDDTLKGDIIRLIGPGAYAEDKLNRSFIASLVFKDKGLLEGINALVHPAVKSDFIAWAKGQSVPYILQEAAVLFENGAYKNLDRMILVTAPREERIQRVMLRDGVTRERVLERMQNQWEDEQKIPLADYVIQNTDREKTRFTTGQIHLELLEISDLES